MKKPCISKIKKRRLIAIVMTFLFVISCSEKLDYYSLGVNSYDEGAYALAKNQFKMIKEGDLYFASSKTYLLKIDSITNKTVLDAKIRWLEKDKINKLFRSKYASRYSVEVWGVSSEKSVERYELKENGSSIYTFVYDPNTSRERVDDYRTGTWIAAQDTITIQIAGLEETYVFNGYYFTDILIPKRSLKRLNQF